MTLKNDWLNAVEALSRIEAPTGTDKLNPRDLRAWADFVEETNAILAPFIVQVKHAFNVQGAKAPDVAAELRSRAHWLDDLEDFDQHKEDKNERFTH